MVPTTIKMLDRITDGIGRVLSTASLAVVVITFITVLMRYVFKLNDLTLFGWELPRQSMEESVLYLHSLLFMLASAYTLRHDAHVRVDVFYRDFTPRTKAVVNLVGTLVFLLPVAGFIIYSSVDYVSFSWKLKEHSQEADGLAYVYVLKTLIPLMGGMLIFQGLVEALRSIAVLLGLDSDAAPEQARV